MNRRPTRSDAPRLGALLSFISLLAACGGGATCPETAAAPTASAGDETAASGVAPTLRGTYVIERVTTPEGGELSVDTLIRQLELAGAHWALVFDDDAVGPELLMIFDEGTEDTSGGPRRVFTVASCGALAAVTWTAEDRFVLARRISARGTTELVTVAHHVDDAGGEVTDTDEVRDRCSTSLDAGEFVILERGAAGEDGRPRTVRLRNAQGATFELSATVPIDDVNLGQFVRSIVDDEPSEGAAD